MIDDEREITRTLTLQEFVAAANQSCFYCQNQLADPVQTSAGLDRIDNSKEYEPGNVVSACYLCNAVKHEHLSVEEMKVVMQTLIQSSSFNIEFSSFEDVEASSQEAIEQAKQLALEKFHPQLQNQKLIKTCDPEVISTTIEDKWKI